MYNKILFDTCAWVDFLRLKDGVLGDYVSLAIERDQVVLCGVVIAELLQGAKGEKEQRQLEFLFTNIEILPIEESTWFAAGKALQKLRSNGITLPLSDAVIAMVAITHNVPVLTIDKHFKHLSVELVGF